MIALLKLYKKIIQRDGNTYEGAGAHPYAIYNNGILETLDEIERFQMFANTGRVFVTESYQLPQKEIFRLFELIESNSFDETRPSSMKYLLGKEIFNLNLYEVIDLDESITLDKSKIVEKLSKGIYIPFVVSNQLLFRTADDFLIGPIQMEFEEGIYSCKNHNLNFIPYYQQEVDIVAILEGYKNQERLFCTNPLEQENIAGWIDVADEQRVISDALKQLKDNADLSELSRKMIARLKEWYDSERAREPHLQERLQRAIQIMGSNTLTDEVITLFTNLVLDLEITKKIIDQQTQGAFEREYENFLKENEKLIKEYNTRKLELEKIKGSYEENAQALEMSKLKFLELEKTMQDKIKQLQYNFSELYAEQLTLSSFPYPQSTASISVSNNNLRGFAQHQSSVGKTLIDFNDFKNHLNTNLASFKGNDETGVLAATIFTSIILGEPVIIFGDNSFELAQCIAKTLACEQTISIIPEIETFSLNDLHHQYRQYSMTKAVKALIIHNPHTTAGLYSLPTYFKQSKWTEDTLFPDLILITIDSIEEGEHFIDKMLYKPLINSGDYMSRFINKRSIKTIQSGQITLEKVEMALIEEYSVSIRREFREWIEDSKDLDVEIPYQLLEWLNQISELVNDAEFFEWSYKIFRNSISTKKKDEQEVEV
ncbi:hypothetical protein [Lysinibacillus sp. FSL W8-0953]|uniref:hypothetical protein n=1 Tax=Lysinibacillus sp. FSL W8-0953 TaxID=2954640 RepID=UPI0030F6105E